MGIMINFFSKEYKNSSYFYKNLLNYIINYLSSRQVAGKSQRLQKLSFEKSEKFFRRLHKLKNKNLIKKELKNIYSPTTLVSVGDKTIIISL